MAVQRGRKHQERGNFQLKRVWWCLVGTKGPAAPLLPAQVHIQGLLFYFQEADGEVVWAF